MKRSICRFVPVIILAVILSGSAAAQTFLFKNIPGERPQIGLRYLRPNFKADNEMSTFSGIYDVTLSLPINDRWSIDASLPYTRFSLGEDGDSESFIGNIYAGMQYISKAGNKNTIVSFGAYLPTAESDIEFFLYGILTNYEDMFKYYPDAWTLYGNFAYFNIEKGGARLGLEIGPDLLIPTGDADDDTEFLMHYGLTAGYQGERFMAAVELIGLAMITEDLDDFGDRFAHSISFGASYISPHFAPGVFYKLYLRDEFTDLVDGVLGVKLEVTL